MASRLVKRGLEDFAIFGGAPALREALHVGRPNIGDRHRLLARIEGALDRRCLTNDGPCVQELEQRLAALLDVRHCVAVSSGTAGLQLAAHALGLQGEVIMPSLTFVATAHALQWQGITPVFCDVDPASHNIDPAQIERLITPRTSAILGVHLWGRACDVVALADIGQRRNIALLFDAAHGFGCSCNGRMIGTFGAAEVFSFHATKIFNTLEGGAVATNDDAIAARVRRMRNFGLSAPERVSCLGINAKMNEISAAMGLTSLESLDQFVEVSRDHYRRYQRELAGLPGVHAVTYDERERCNFHYVVLEVDAAAAELTRDELVAVLRAENVMARRYFHPGCHRVEPYRSRLARNGVSLPSTELLASRVLALPTGGGVTSEEVRTVCSLVRSAVADARRIHERLGATRQPSDEALV